MPTFSLEEVKKHNHVKDLWVINQNKVYDVTTFVEKHPGGKEVLAEFAGSNVTEIMREPSSHNFGHKHTKYAYSLLQSHYIGDLEKGGQRNHTDGVHRRQTHEEKKSTEETDVPQPNFEENITEDTLIDWNKPILWQVGSLGDKYMDWVHKPVDRKIRLFRSNFCEMCGNAYWWTVPSFWVPVILLLLYSSYQNGQSTGPDWLGISPVVMLPVYFALGILSWTFIEYVVHRWLFHLTPPANSKFLITMHFLYHGQHHKSPFDKKRLVFPIVPALPLALTIYLGYCAIFPIHVAQAYMAGTISGYMGYDLTHYYLHHGTPSLQYFRNLKRYHVRHHFEDIAKGFGISSKLWDYPFGTLIQDN
ncbi:fatty acid 2-hydroxylase [Lingula anatina]|uniref:Fatty acid 2-hydroxylase n=1 Tax=Lingula anatina TaxID=7574 RepID=A0A1S3I5J3_LINAN|nr:fatty acid 2-hydroxylase [Lingula anatina]|eukprot:XP_013392633.1 fatty acid 2-hydroxylase [Lingula anatina]